MFALIGGDVRHGGGGGRGAGPAVPGHAAAPAATSRGWPGDYRAVVAGLSGPRRPARRLPRRAPGARAVRAVGDAVGAPADARRTPPRTCRCATCTATPTRSSPTGRTCPPTCAPRARPRPVVEAPQSVDNEYWNGHIDPNSARRVPGGVCRQNRAGKRISSAHSGLEFLGPVSTQRRAGSGRRRSDPSPGRRHRRGPARRPRSPPAEVRNFYAGSDVVVVPSVPTRDFREPWGLVVNEAFNQGVPVIATDAVGAVAGGLVRHERTGLVVPAGDVAALAAALRRMHDDPALRARLGAAGREAVKAYTHDAWAAGVSSALAAVGSEPLLAWKAMVRLLTLSGLILLLAAPDGERGRPREDPARVPGGPHHRQLHAGAAPRRAQAHPDRHRRVLRLPRRARAGRAGRPQRQRQRLAAARGVQARRAACSPPTGAQPADRHRPGESHGARRRAPQERQAVPVGDEASIPGAAGFAADARATASHTVAARPPDPARPLRLRRDVRVRPPTCPRSPSSVSPRVGPRPRALARDAGERRHGADLGRRARDRRGRVRRRAAGLRSSARPGPRSG